MENTLEKNEAKNDLFIRVKAVKTPNNKTAEELLDKVTMVAVEVSETLTQTEEVMDLNIHIQTRSSR